MYLAISVLIFIICVLLILIVLVQNSKGGGLAANFSSSNQIMGVRKTTDFLEKATWTLAGVVAFLSVLSIGFIPSQSEAGQQSIIKDEVENAVNVDPNLTSPNFGAQQAATEAPAKAPAQTGEQAPVKAPAAKK